MLLTAYISNKIKALADDPKRGRTGRRYANCLKILRRFLAGSEPDILSLADDRFIAGFSAFLDGELAAEYGADYRADVISTLRNFSRQAIREGYLPNIDFFPQTDSEQYSVTPVDVDRHLRNLLVRVANLRQKRQIRYKNKSIILYLIGLFLRGLEISEVLGLRKLTADDGAVTIHHPVFGVDITLDREILSLVNLYNGPLESDTFLIAIAEKESAEGRLSLRAEKATKEVAAFLKEAHIPLFLSHSVFADWLAILAGSGVDAPRVAELVRARFNREVADELSQFITSLPMRVIDPIGFVRRNWHVLVSHAARLRGADMKKRVRKEEGLDIDLQREAYDPYDGYRVKVRNRLVARNNAAVSNLLFLKVNNHDAALIDRLFPEASLLRRTDARRRFATVPEAEIRRLILFLKDFREDLQIVADMGEWIKDSDVKIEKDMKVRILNGPFCGAEGTVMRIKKNGKDKVRDIFVIQLYQQNFVIQANLSRLELEPITAPAP